MKGLRHHDRFIGNDEPPRLKDGGLDGRLSQRGDAHHQRCIAIFEPTRQCCPHIRVRGRCRGRSRTIGATSETAVRRQIPSGYRCCLIGRPCGGRGPFKLFDQAHVSSDMAERIASVISAGKRIGRPPVFRQAPTTVCSASTVSPRMIRWPKIVVTRFTSSTHDSTSS